MILESWAEYLPPPGSTYRITYVVDFGTSGGTVGSPDLDAFGRSLDRRPGVALRDIRLVSGTRSDVIPGDKIVAVVDVFLGDTPLVTALGSYHSDGENFWRVRQVERIDDKAMGGLELTVRRALDATLDPLQDVATASRAAVVETTHAVTRVGIPSVAVIAIVVGAFLFFRR